MPRILPRILETVLPLKRPARGGLLICLLFVTAAIAQAHESNPLFVSINANQDRQISLSVVAELEPFLVVNTVGLAREHSSDAEQLMLELETLSDDELIQRFRSAYRNGSTFLHISGSRNNELPLKLESIVAKSTSSEGIAQSSEQIILGDLRRKFVITFSSVLPADHEAISVVATEPSQAMIVTVDNESGSGERRIEQQQYVQAGERSDPLVLLGGTTTQGTGVLVDYIHAGFLHIIPKGLDHVLFMMALVLLSPGWKLLLWQISLFTVAHSVSLGLGILGLVRFPAAVVEPLIAASIVYLCLEILLDRRQSHIRSVVIVFFGLLHGLGFATVLAEYGLREGAFALALFGFNFGIEIAQLMVVVVFSALIAGVRRYLPVSSMGTTAPLSLLVGATAVYMLLSRVSL